MLPQGRAATGGGATAIGPRRGRRRGLALALASVLGLTSIVLVAGQATAQSPSASGSVVALDHGDLVLDLSSSKGAAVGNSVELWRPLKLRHPVTGRVLIDRFRIGTLRLTQVGETLSLATPSEQLQRAAEPGDVVILRLTTPPPRSTPEPKPEPKTPSVAAKPKKEQTPAQPAPSAPSSDPEAAEPVESDPEAKALSAIFDSLQSADLVTRIRTYEDYVRTRPQGRFSRVLYEEAQALRQLLSGQGATPKPTEADPERARVRRFRRPEQVFANTPLQLGLEVWGSLAGVVLHIRNEGEPTYRSYPLQGVGRGYFSVALPAGTIQAPAQEYFFEGVRADGTAFPLEGDAKNPGRLPVAEPAGASPATKHLYSMSLWTDYADYNRLRHNDWASQTEGFFGMRFGDVGVRSLRSGFGVYRGAGGSIRDLDELGYSSRAIGLTYGYLETELGVSSFFSFIARGAIGLRDTGLSGGTQLLIRIGNDRKTNLQLGGEVLGGVGLRSITQLELNTFPRVPIVLRTEVTNQPAGTHSEEPEPTDSSKSIDETSKGVADIGARAIAQVGYRITPDLTVSLRGSYQGRTIRHAGPGVGAGVTYEW